MFRRILVPVGLGLGSLAAARYAEQLSRWLGGRVILLGIGEHPREALEDLAQQIRRPPALLRVESGTRPLAEVIARVAWQTRSDLIVIASPEPGLEPLIQGVVASCGLPVHVIPQGYDPQADRWGWLEATALESPR